jgi:uncharacterized protein
MDGRGAPGAAGTVKGSRSEAADALVVLRRRIDEHFEQAHRRSPRDMRCGRGCDSCCHARLSVFAVEAARIEAALCELSTRAPAVRERVRLQADDPSLEDRCPMLVDGACAIYADRPVICRSHGLPIALEDDDGAMEVHWCTLNYVDADPPAASVLRLDAVNKPLSVMALMWDGRGDRVELTALARGRTDDAEDR